MNDLARGGPGKPAELPEGDRFHMVCKFWKFVEIMNPTELANQIVEARGKKDAEDKKWLEKKEAEFIEALNVLVVLMGGNEGKFVWRKRRVDKR